MTQAKITTPSSPSGRVGTDATKTALAAGGLVAAFGVASCCALPIALAAIGVGASSLVGVGYLAAQYQRELFYIAVACLAAAAIIMWRQRRATACAPGKTCARPTLIWGSRIGIGLALALLALTFWVEPPI